MYKPKDPREVALAMISRSSCSVQVGSALVDSWGVFSWGHNHSGPDGFGEHAEIHCLKRANKRRLMGATLFVAAQRARNKKIITSRPCELCQKKIPSFLTVIYRDEHGKWIKL
jgi:tRNA(Arg) A34 adenosine deaminase TadA